MMAASLIISLVYLIITTSAVTSINLKSSLLTSLETSKTIDVLVSLKGCQVRKILEEFSTPLSGVQPRSVISPDSFPRALESHAFQSQEKLLNFLRMEKMGKSSENRNMSFKSLWLSNKVLVREASLDLIKRLSKFPEVEGIEEDKLMSLSSSLTKPSVSAGGDPKSRSIPSLKFWRDGLPQPNILAMGAPAVWREGYRGNDVVVGVIDSGVNSNHLSLVRNFRGKYGWFDAVNGRSIPYDDHGHGTHAVGIATGFRGIGVAPNADFMACKALDRNGYYRESWLVSCAMFMLCPWDASGRRDCSQRPRIVLIPWTLQKGMRLLDGVVEALDAAGVFTVVSAGDSGERGCGSIMPPADVPSVFSVGALNQYTRMVLPSTGSGPGLRNSIKPDVTAPGLHVLSASFRNPVELLFMSGSEPAAAHVAGLVALALEKNPRFSISDLRASLLIGAADVTPSSRACSGSGNASTPNYNTGFGFLHGALSVNLVAKFS